MMSCVIPEALEFLSPQKISERRRNRVIVNMLVVYGDDSSDRKRKRVFAVASLIARQDAWDNLAPIWTDKTGGIPYHATDCLAGQGSYKGWDAERGQRLHGDLVNLIFQFPIGGFAFVADVSSFAEIMNGTKRSEIFLYCFAHMVGGVSAIVQSYNENRENGHERQAAKFVFDSDNDQVNAGYLFSVLHKMKQWDELTADCTGSVEFAFNPKPVGIQAVDLWAYEVRNEFDKKLRDIQCPSYASNLLSSEEGRFIRKEYFREDIIEARKRIDQMGDSGYSLAYSQWLTKHRRQNPNNPQNRIAFLSYWDSVLCKKDKGV